MTFAELKAHLLALIGRAPSALCYELTTADINARLRIREMESTSTLVEAAEITLPTNFMGVVSVYRDTADRTPLQPTTLQGINRSHLSSGTPTEYALADGIMVLNPAPNGTENIKLRYYAKLAALSADGDTNDILTKHPAIYVYGALAHHSVLIRDMQAAAGWKGSFEEAMRIAKTSDQTDRYSGAPMAPTVPVTP